MNNLMNYYCNDVVDCVYLYQPDYAPFTVLCIINLSSTAHNWSLDTDASESVNIILMICLNWSRIDDWIDQNFN